MPAGRSIILKPGDVHALSNHLAVIIGFVELLITDSTPGSPHFNDLIQIRAAAVAAANLIAKPGPDI